MTRRDITDAVFALTTCLLLAGVILAAASIAQQPPAPATSTDTAATAASCTRSNRTVIINLDNRRHRPILRHVWAATRRGHPEHLHLDRAGADARRRAALRGIPTRPGLDRDEYPPAVSRQGGAGASVRYVDASINRSAGAVMGAQLRPYCDDQSFRYERRPRR